MSEAKFTKGEWNCGKGDLDYSVERNDYHSCAWMEIKSNSGDTVALSVTVSDYDDEMEANASLIIAAPDMYDILHSIENDSNQIPTFLWDKIQSVLAKARGEHV